MESEQQQGGHSTGTALLDSKKETETEKSGDVYCGAESC